MSQLPEPPDQFLCPVSEELMVEPVMLVETGQTYDRTSIEGWFAKGKNTCPLSGRDLEAKQLVPNFAVKKMINEWIQSNCGNMTVHQVRTALRDGIAASEAISVGSIAPSAMPGGPEPWRPPSENDAHITPVASIEQGLQGLTLGAGGPPPHQSIYHDAYPGPASAPIYETASSTAPYGDDGGADAGERAAAAASIMQTLTGPDMDPGTFAEAASYHLWQLKELALDEQCRDVLLSRGIAPLLVQVFRACSDTDAAANAALCIKRLAVEGPSVCQVFVGAHVIDYLVVMLRTREHSGCREQAAMALTVLGWNCWRTKQEIIVKLCQEVKQSLGSTNIVLAFRELLASGATEEHEAIAFAVHMLSENVQTNVLEYFSCRTNELAAVLASVLSSGTDAARFAAVNALRNLAGNSNNRMPIVRALVRLLREGNARGQEQAAWLLWELAYDPQAGSGGAGGNNPHIVSALSRAEGLVVALAAGLAADTSRSCKELTAGLLHVMVYQRANDRDVNRMAAGVDFDAVRFQLTAGGTGIVDRLAAMLCAPDAETQTRVLAVYALSNLAGTVNTGPCPACAHSTAKLGGLLKKAPEVCVHNPRMAVSLQAEALSVVFDMLESSNVADIAASVALLNNLCYKVDDARDRAKAEAKKRGTDNIKARLQFLVEDDFLAKQLSGPTRNGAINIHQRFDRHKPQVDSPLIWRAIKPPKRHPVYAPL